MVFCSGEKMRRKLTGLILCISLVIQPMAGLYTADAEAAAKVVRVKLSMGAPTSVSFYIDGNYSVADYSAISLDRQLYTVKLESGKLSLYYGAAKLMGGAASLRFVQRAATPGRNNFIWMKNATYGYLGYLGDMQFNISSGSIEVVNHVYVEDYLYGVVPHEMSNSFPLEALKAQAVAARNYVIGAMKTSGTSDLGDTSLHQVYKGFNAANDNAIAAVDQTAKMVLACGGKLVDIYYGASNGGWTEIPQHVWTATAPLQPYQVIQPDPYDVQNPSSLQEVLTLPKTITASAKITSSANTTGKESANAENYLKDSAAQAVAAAMIGKGYTPCATFQIVKINKVVPNTYVSQHEIKDYTGKDPCVYYQNAAINMTVLPGDAVKLGDVNSDGAISVSDYTLVRLDILGIKPLSGTARAAADVNGDGAVSVSDYTLIRLDILGIKKIQPKSTVVQEPITVDFTIDMTQLPAKGAFYYSNSTLRLYTVGEDGNNWYIYHRRYGHGIGLSQRGAQQRAKSTDAAVNTYEKILGFYFPGSETKLTAQAYDRPALTAITPADTSNAAVVNITTTLSVRSGSPTGNIIGALPNAARIHVTGTESGWCKINYGNDEAYVSASYVQMDP
jgi:SpoIID/LytB domain protein